MTSTDQATTRTEKGGDVQPGFSAFLAPAQSGLCSDRVGVSSILTDLAWPLSNRFLRRGDKERLKTRLTDEGKLFSERLSYYQHTLRVGWRRCRLAWRQNESV